jgi:hypothetical protein
MMKISDWGLVIGDWDIGKGVNGDWGLVNSDWDIGKGVNGDWDIGKLGI